MYSIVLSLEYTSVYYPLDVSCIFHQSSKSKQASLWREGVHGLIYIDNINILNDICSKLNVQPSQLSVTLRQEQTSITVFIRGSSPDLVNFARQEVLKGYTHITCKTLELTLENIQALIDAASASNTGETIVSSFFTRLDGLSSANNIEFIITFDGKITIFGGNDNVTTTETQVRLLINTLLEGFFVDTYDIALSTLPLIGGEDLINFSQISRQLNCNIYVPDLLPDLFNSGILQSTSNLPIYIGSKDISSILLTQNLLDKLFKSCSEFFVKEVMASKGKLDLITLLDQAEILQIMFRNSVFIEFPSLGESNSQTVRIQGHSSNQVHDAMSDLNSIIAKYYTVTVNTSSPISADTLLQLLRSRKSCLFTANTYGFELLAKREDIVVVLSMLSTSSIVTSVSISIEINNSQRDFISGKKNGKFLKVLNQLEGVGLSSIVEFESYNEYNFLMKFHVSAESSLNEKAISMGIISLSLKGLELLYLEIPAELKFNIPDVFHKSIIGNGGSIIQSIMKKYNVFIKFSSHSPSDLQTTPYTLTRPKNVLIKCPNKNAKNIPLVKYEIDNLVYRCCESNLLATYPNSTVYLTTHFRILKVQYISMLNHDNHNMNYDINSIESQTNTFIDFPKSIESFGEAESLTFKIKGSDIKSKMAGLRISELLPQCYRIKISYLPGKFENCLLIDNQEFVTKIVNPFKILLGGLELSVILEGSNALENPLYHLILIHHWGNEEILNKAINELKSFLRLKNLNIMDKEIFNYDGIVDTPVVVQQESPTKKLKSITNTNLSTTSTRSSTKYQNQQRKNRMNNKKPFQRQNLVAS